jgi:hypothetical protein
MTTKDPTFGCDGLIAAFTIFKKYSDAPYLTHCEHDKLYVCISPRLVSDEDKVELEKLHFDIDEDEDTFYSYVFGSC